MTSEPTAHLLWSCLGRHRATDRRGSIALRSGRGDLSYDALASAVAAGAEEIRRRAPGRVVIAGRDQWRVAVAFLSALAAGRTPLLVDPTTPERVRAIARRWDGTLFADENLAGGDERAIPLAATEAWTAGAGGADLRIAAVDPRDEAFWVFTSGSTGEPKPVVHCHRAPVAACEGFAGAVLGLGPADVTVATAGLPFVYALGNNLLFPLMTGASCVLPADLLLPTVLGHLSRHGATVLVAGPWSLEALARLATREDRREPLRRLRLVLSAGEPLPPPVFREWRERFGSEPLDNLGCTETFNSFLANPPGDARPGSLGRLVPGYEVEVGAAPPRPARRGALRVRGESRAIAVGDPFRRIPPEEWLEPGDEVEVDADGRFVFLGRLDDRFKVKGRFVLPLEVERCLLEVDGVRECLVVPEPGERGITRVVARIVAEDGASTEELRRRILRHARARLASHELPAELRFESELPRTSRGKRLRPRTA